MKTSSAMRNNFDSITVRFVVDGRKSIMAAATTAADSPQPTQVEYHDPTEHIAALQEDNDVLRSMLQRSASATGAYRDAVASDKLCLINDKLMEDVRSERERRARAEAALSQDRDQHELALHKKDVEMRKAQAALIKSKNDLEAAKKKEQELEKTIADLRSENAQIRETLKRHKLNPDGTHAGSGAAVVPPPDYHLHRVPVKPFSSLLRSISPHTSQRLGNGSNNVLSPPPKGLTPRITKQQPHDADTAQRRGTYSSADPLRQASKSPTPSAAPRRIGSTLPEFKIGSKIVWHGVPGIVKYVGIVHCLGAGTWFGVELSEIGKGEHNGTLSGIRYFTSEKRSGIFCKAAELSGPRPPPPKPLAAGVTSPESPTKDSAGTTIASRKRASSAAPTRSAGVTPTNSHTPRTGRAQAQKPVERTETTQEAAPTDAQNDTSPTNAAPTTATGGDTSPPPQQSSTPPPPTDSPRNTQPQTATTPPPAEKTTTTAQPTQRTETPTPAEPAAQPSSQASGAAAPTQETSEGTKPDATPVAETTVQPTATPPPAEPAVQPQDSQPAAAATNGAQPQPNPPVDNRTNDAPAAAPTEVTHETHEAVPPSPVHNVVSNPAENEQVHTASDRDPTDVERPVADQPEPEVTTGESSKKKSKRRNSKNNNQPPQQEETSGQAAVTPDTAHGAEHPESQVPGNA
jgi:hypothetical protein